MKHDLAGGFTLPSIPKRTLVAEPIADRFTDAANDEVEGPSSRVMPKSSKLRRAEHGERMVVYVPTEIATELRVRCARERRSLSDAVTAAVEAWARSAVGT